MLQDLVNRHVLTLADDTHFDKLKKSSAELTKRLQKSKEKTLGFIYAAIDSNVSPASKEIKEVQEIITKGWSTFSSTAKDSAVNYIRAVILESLEALSKDADFASLIWQASRHALKFYHLLGEEKTIVQKFLLDIGLSLQSTAEKQWSMESSPELSGFKSEVMFLPIDKARLEAFLKSAATDKAYGGENPVNVSGYDSWHTYFAKRSAQGISEEAAKSVRSAVNEIVANQKRLIEYFDKNVRAQEIRSKLIWWKEAGYSRSYAQRYKEVPKEVLELILARDYASFLASTTPVSVEYFLLNAFEQLSGEANASEEITFDHFFTQLASVATELQKIFPAQESDRSRISVLEFASGLIWEKYQIGEFYTLTGIEGTKKVSRSDLLLWFYNDEQVLKLINN